MVVFSESSQINSEIQCQHATNKEFIGSPTSLGRVWDTNSQGGRA